MTKINFDDQHVRAKAVAYLRAKLEEGKTLAALLHKHIDFLQGTVVALTPVPLGMKQSVEFGDGHQSFTHESGSRVTVGEISGIRYPKPNASEQLVDLIAQSLGNEKSICLLENPLAAPQDSWLKRAHSRILMFNDEVYHVLTAADRTNVNISTAVREAHAPTLLLGAVGKSFRKVQC